MIGRLEVRKGTAGNLKGVKLSRRGMLDITLHNFIDDNKA